MLKGKNKNPHAALIGLFMNSCHEVHEPIGDLMKYGQAEAFKVKEFLDIGPALASKDISNPDMHRFNDARTLVRDNDMHFKRFTDECQLERITKEAGLEMKTDNTIIREWPTRLKKKPTKKEFEVALGSGHMGSNRYVEWKNLI